MKVLYGIVALLFLMISFGLIMFNPKATEIHPKLKNGKVITCLYTKTMFSNSLSCDWTGGK